MPGELSKHYTTSEVAAFSRWYIGDYPVTVWQHEAGLLVLGQERHSIWKRQIMLDYDLASNLVNIVGYILIGNLLLILLFCLILGYRFYCSLKPVAAGIEGLAKEEQISMIMGYAEQLEAADNLEAEQKKQLETIKHQGEMEIEDVKAGAAILICLPVEIDGRKQE